MQPTGRFVTPGSSSAMHLHIILSAQPGGSKVFATGGKFGAGVFMVASKSIVLA